MSEIVAGLRCPASGDIRWMVWNRSAGHYVGLSARKKSGIRNRGPGPAFLVITPALTFLAFGPPEVGQDWEVEPAELDGFSAEEGRIRIVGMERHRTGWGNVADCEFGTESGPVVDS